MYISSLYNKLFSVNGYKICMQINYRNCFYLGLCYDDIRTISLQFKYLFIPT